MKIKFELGTSRYPNTPKKDCVFHLLPTVVFTRIDGDVRVWVSWLCFYAGISIY
jgi:hypothetical protein